MNKPKLIIIEAAQGVGKSTITTMLREKIVHSTLMRLSGIEDKTKETGKQKVFNLRLSELDFIDYNRFNDTTFILDRCHLTEKVYCNLKYKDYDFQYETNVLNDRLNSLGRRFDVYVILLTLNDVEELNKRLHRDKTELGYTKFNIYNSINQQQEYYKEINNIANNYRDINIAIIENNASPHETYNKIAKFCGLEL